MAFEAKTIDEEVAGLVDSYDAMIAPKTVWRNNNNKLYLVFKSIGAGFSKIRDVVLALKYRFDPRYCDEDDLDSAMLITGETRITGKASMLRIVVVNNDTERTVSLGAGTYTFLSSDGQPFSFSASASIPLSPLAYSALLFVSRDEGAWPVQDMVSATVTRSDGVTIDSSLSFEAFDNSGALGRMGETTYELRQRLLTDATRQDSLREIELAVKALPSIFECNVIFNPSEVNPAPIEDGTVLQPKELLLIITGVPTQELAEIVVSRTVYKTHMNTADEVVWYNNPLLAGGRYPVYFMYHKKQQFHLTLNYRFDSKKMQKEDVDAAFETMLRKYRFMTTHIDEINEPLLYRDVQDHGLPGVELKKIYIQTMNDGILESVATVTIPKLMLPELVGSINFIDEDIENGS